MKQLGIETGQNVIIKKDLANIGERIGSQAIDYFIIFSYLMIIFMISDAFIGLKSKDIFIVILIIPVFFYSLLSEIFMNGQSLGKKTLKIKVEKIEGGQPTVGSYIIRWVFRLIDVNFLYGSVAMITIAINGKGQRLGDLVAKTSVISLKRKNSLKNTIYVDLPEEYKLSFPEIEKLEQFDIQTIKDVVAYYEKNLTNKSAISMLKDTATAIKEKTGIISFDVPLLFLEKIIKDYNFIHKVKK